MDDAEVAMLLVILIPAVVLAAVAVGIYLMTPAGRMFRSTEPPPEPEERPTGQKRRRNRPRKGSSA
jgi:hypothetical protein